MVVLDGGNPELEALSTQNPDQDGLITQEKSSWGWFVVLVELLFCIDIIWWRKI